MIKKLVLLSVVILSIFFLYVKNSDTHQLEIWSVIPSNSLLVFEIKDPLNKWRKFSGEVNENDFKQLKKAVNKELNDFDEFLNNKLDILSENNELIISVSKTSNNNFDLLFSSYKNKLDLNFIIKKLTDSLSFDVSTRIFNSHKIYEFLDDESLFSAVVLGDVISVSRNSLLIEDAIRTSNKKSLQFRYVNNQLFNQVMIQNDLGNIFVNFLELSKSFQDHKHLFNILPEKTFLDIRLRDNIFYLSGFSTNNTKKLNDSILVDDDMTRFIPTNSNYFTSSAISHKINRNIIEYGRFSFKSSYSNLNHEIIILDIYKNDFLKLNINDFNDNEIIEIQNNIVLEALDSLKYEYEKIFIYKGKKKFYISSSYNSLIEFEEIYTSNNFWRKEIKFSKFLSNLNKNQNTTILLNYKELSKNYSFLDNSILKEIDLISIQLSSINDKFYTTVNLNSNSDSIQVISDSNLTFKAKNKLTSKPFIYFSHVDNSPQVITQDENNILYQLDKNLNKIWEDSIDSQIISKPIIIDYYNNRKKQILFATKNKIYCYDRLGNILPGFPIENPNKNDEIDDINIIDYDKSKRYRISLSSGNKVFLIDKYGKILNGWNPLVMEDLLVEAPKHFRVRGKDYILLSLENGDIFLKNRKGSNYTGFPIKLENKLYEKIFIDLGQNFNNTSLVALDELGKTYFIGIDGKIKKENQMFRRSKNSKFKILTDPLEKSYMRLSVDDDVIYFKENTLNFKNKIDFTYQFYSLGEGKSFLAVTDPKEKLTYFLDMDLEPKFKNIFNEKEISVIHSKDISYVYTTFNRTISVIEIKN
tara:strand:+ start:3759 stop:6194 length:2436 start_codon:yes stop_codon:yes gene_type:complete